MLPDLTKGTLRVTAVAANDTKRAGNGGYLAKVKDTELVKTMAAEIKAEEASPEAQARREAKSRTFAQPHIRDKQKAPEPINPAARELMSRRLARRRLLPFVVRLRDDYRAGWVHREVAEALEQFSKDVAAEKSPRLMIAMPPRHGKSLLASQMFPAWHLGQHPHHEIIASAYALSLPMDFSRTVRETLRDPEYTRLFSETRLSADAQNAEAWKTTRGGGYRAAGVGGPLTGHGAHIAIIDDPVKNWEEAQSDTVLESVWRWYASTLYTRLAPGGGVLVIQTRWNMRDLSGRLLSAMEDGSGDQWQVLTFPALAQSDEPYRLKGEPLHPERYNEEYLLKIKRQDPTVFEALYQQNPVNEAGGYFQPNMFRTYRGKPPEKLRYYGTWDLAITKSERSDYTVGITFGVDTHGDIYVVDQVRDRLDSYEIAEAMCQQYQEWSPEMISVEKGHIQLAMGPLLETMIAERGLYGMAVTPVPPGRRDKESRARSIQGRMRQGRVWFPEDAPWFDDLRLEMLQFPNGLFDDRVDAMAYVGLMLQDLDAAQDRKGESDEERHLRYRNSRYGGGKQPQGIMGKLAAVTRGLRKGADNAMTA